MAKPTLLPDPTCLHLKLLDASETTITAVVVTTSKEAACSLQEEDMKLVDGLRPL